MTKTLTRRDFLKLSGSAIGAVAVGEFIPPLVAQGCPGKWTVGRQW